MDLIKTNKRPLSEQQALEKLGVNSFREISKNNILDFMSTLPDMDREVAIKALEQFPEFSKCTISALSDYKEMLLSALENEKTGHESACEAYMITINSLKKLLETDNLSFNQKMKIAEKMNELGDKISKETDGHREWLLSALDVAGKTCLGFICVTGTLLGLKIIGTKAA